MQRRSVLGNYYIKVKNNIKKGYSVIIKPKDYRIVECCDYKIIIHVNVRIINCQFG